MRDIEDISPYYNKERFIQLTIEQIKKDFDSFGMVLSLDDDTDTAHHKLLEQLTAIIQSLLHEKRELFFSVLYRIDINESVLMKTAESSNHAAELAKLIIDRELKKVIVREYFSRH